MSNNTIEKTTGSNTRRPTKLEEATFKVHLDIDGDKETALENALERIKQLTQFIVGQEDIEKHEVNLVVNISIREKESTIYE